MKVIFTDHFGVLCLANKHGIESKWDELPRINEMRVHNRFDNFDEGAVKVFNSILENDVEVVVSSDWKRWSSINDMGEFYLSQGIIKKPLSSTPNFNELEKPDDFKLDNKFIVQQQRSFEIKYWLKEHSEVDSWVAIDDLYLGDVHHSWGLKNFVWINRTDEGLKQLGVKEKVSNFLN